MNPFRRSKTPAGGGNQLNSSAAIALVQIHQQALLIHGDQA